ncbi:MAG: ABC transporter ATP-binding protein [Myxococcota bacterium]
MTKTYGQGDAELTVLHGIDLTVKRGETLALCGPSGSGKSTLLNLIGCLDRPSGGRIWVAEKDVSSLDRVEQAAMRLRTLGFIFQSFNLLSDATALENVMMPLVYAGVARSERRSRATEVLERVGLSERSDHLPSQLSGGQKQRVAIARACVTRPKILLADEPTGALDTKTGRDVLELLDELHRQDELTIIMVTHDDEVAAWAQRRIDLRDGVIVAGGPAA